MTDVLNASLDGLTLKDLGKLQTRVNAAIAKAEKANKRKALAAIKDLLAKRGFTLADIAGAAPPSRKRRGQGKSKPPAPPKYRDPNNESHQWSGKGRPPQWFKDARDRGVDRKEMEIAGFGG